MAESLNLSDRRMESPQSQQKSPLSFLGNGKAEWAWRIFMLLGAAFVSYMAAEHQVDKRVSVLEERQLNQNSEVLRAIQELREDIRAMRLR